MWNEIKERIKSSPLSSVSGIVTLSLLIPTVIGLTWGIEPDMFDVKPRSIKGETTTRTVIQLTENLLNKSGGLLYNDVNPISGFWLDNVPNWEYGNIILIRDITNTMRNQFSRSQSQSPEDPDLSKAEPRLQYSINSWIFPSSEGEYEEGTVFLKAYLKRITDNNATKAQFYTRSDNLREFFKIVEKRLGGYSQQLSASVGEVRFNTELSGDPDAQTSTKTRKQIRVKTGYFKLDDIFYETRGYTYGLIHVLKALETEFQEVLANKNALQSMKQIIRELEQTQRTSINAIVAWGWINQSVFMSSYISRANAAMIDLRDLLRQG
ncbi:MAG: DUF2333 family protein [Magnetococcales bacterium]|nr:DUF2333 family protein [Magnetococcales bacterium]